jgi:hypothetical protein
MKEVCTTIIVTALMGAYLMTTGCADDKALAENETTNDAIWGNPFKGVALSVRACQSRFRVGENIEISVRIKNFGKEEVLLLTVGGFLDNYRLSLFDLDGWPVPKSKSAVELEALLGQQGMELALRRHLTRIKAGETAPLDGRPVPKSKSVVELETLLGQQGMETTLRRRVTRIKAGETTPGYKLFSLNEWFKIDKEGTYLLVVMRRLWSWDKGFLISNAAKINITKS